jgi:hypothetical protein
MALNFPNESRSYDPARKRVRFWGYDGAIEVSFFVEADALEKLGSSSAEPSGIEAGFLKVFDAARETIHKVADKVYGRSPKGSFVHSLVKADF